MSVDPYKALGLPDSPTPDEVRAAFRRAVLKCHPDSRPGNSDQARREFMELVSAYRGILREMSDGTRPAPISDRTYSPRDFAAGELDWLDSIAPQEYVSAPPAGSVSWRLSKPTLNETAVFVMFWAVGVVCGILAVVWLIGQSWLGALANVSPTAYALAMVLLPILTFAIVLAATIAALVASRKIVYLAIRSFPAGRTLPPPAKAPILTSSPRKENLPPEQ